MSLSYGTSLPLWHTPLGEVQTAVADSQPTPAGVATAAISAAFGLSLLIKVLRITGQRQDLLPAATRVTDALRAAAENDIEAVRTFIKTRDGRAMNEVPKQAAESTAEGLNLCMQAMGSVQGLIAADLMAAIALLQGAANAIAACIAANKR